MKLSKIILMGFAIMLIAIIFGLLLPIAVISNERYLYDNQAELCAKADDCWYWAQGQGE